MSRTAVLPDPILVVAIYVQALPALAYVVSRHRTLPKGFLVVGGLLTLLSTVIGTAIARRYGNNYVVGYFSIPLIAAAYMLALAEWQVTYLERVTFRIGLGMFALIYVVLVTFFEDVTHFGQFSHTLYSFALLVAALWTLGRRSLEQDEGLAIDTDWFWAAFGLAIYGAATAATAAIGNILMARDRVDLFVKAWNLRACFVILAFLSISWGVFRGPPRPSPQDVAG